MLGNPEERRVEVNGSPKYMCFRFVLLLNFLTYVTETPVECHIVSTCQAYTVLIAAN